MTSQTMAAVWRDRPMGLAHSWHGVRATAWLQRLSHRFGLKDAPRGQRGIGLSLQAAGAVPGGLAVACEIDRG